MKYDFIIIGAGPSGSTAALLLLKRGFRVCLIEKKEFPREVLCGEFLSSEVIKHVNNEGLWEKFQKLNPQKINSFRLINSDGRELSAAFDFEAYGLKRSLFDRLLLEEAASQGAQLMVPAEVKALGYDKQGITASVRMDNEEIRIESDTAIAAYGKFNPLDKQLNRSFNGYRSRITGMKFHIHKDNFNEPPFGEIRIYLSRGIYCGINPVSGSEFTVCFLTSAKSRARTVQDHINFLKESNKKFDQLFTGDLNSALSETQVYGTSNLYFGKKEKYLNGIYFTGDASGIIAPLAGDGIGMAIESAKLLADHLSGSYSAAGPDAYAAAWEKLFSSRLKTARAVQTVLLNRFFRTSAIHLAGWFPGMLNNLIKKTRSY